MRTALALTALVALAACPPAFARVAVGSRSAEPGWTVTVSVEPSDLGPIRLSVSNTRTAPVTDAHGWLEHDLVFDNTGDRPITFADTRTAALLGPPGRRMLLASDSGCGYSLHPLGPACLAYLDLLTVKPHRSATRTVTLFKGLRGLAPLEPGRYVFRKTVRFAVGLQPPPPGAGRDFTVRLVYRIEAP
jgi:hypothetical protein